MNRKSLAFIFTMLLIGTSQLLQAQKPILISSSAKEAHLYLNSAELVHHLQVPIKKGLNEVIVKNISNQIDNNSIRVNSNKSITVLSAAFTNQFYSDYEKEPNAEVLKTVKDSIEWVNKKLNQIENKIVTNQQTIQLLDKNQKSGGENTGIKITDLTQLVDYYQKKRLELSNSNYDLSKEQVEWRKNLEDLKNQLTVRENKDEKLSKGKVILQLMSETDQTIQLQISYITNLAYWLPFYEIEATGNQSSVRLISKAKVIQNTGLDWKQIQLAFSSAQPNPNNSIPYFSQWNLRFQDLTPIRIRGYGSMNISPTESARNLDVQARKVAPALAEMAGSDKPVQQTAANYTQVTEQSLSVYYEVKIPYDIRSNGQAQSVTLAEQEMKANYNYYAAPKLNKDVYLIANITDYSQYNLLKGEANIIFEGSYVGKTYLNPLSASDTFQIPLGIDKNIIVKRELIDEKSGNKVFSGKRQSNFNYHLSIRNNKNIPIHLILKDQFPKSTDKEIEVELTQTDKAVINEEVGTLTWEMNIKPQKTETVKFGYQVKYPKDKPIENL